MCLGSLCQHVSCVTHIHKHESCINDYQRQNQTVCYCSTAGDDFLCHVLKPPKDFASLSRICQMTWERAACWFIEGDEKRNSLKVDPLLHLCAPEPSIHVRMWVDACDRYTPLSSEGFPPHSIHSTHTFSFQGERLITLQLCSGPPLHTVSSKQLPSHFKTGWMVTNMFSCRKIKTFFWEFQKLC